MKQFNFLRVAALSVIAIFSIGAAQAATIDGTLNFGGEAVPVPGPDVSDATGLAFVDNRMIVTNATGDFAADSIGLGTFGTISDMTFTPTSGGTIVVGSFTFALGDVQIVDQADMFLTLTGTGTLSAAGFDDTAYAFSMSVDSSGGAYAFSGTLAPVPVPGALLLFMSGLAALGVRRRN